uniref:Uncharacterized protein n=1 Tax=Oryza brachyantha TaxID=4533 RepID=J3MZV5_ORYBR
MAFSWLGFADKRSRRLNNGGYKQEIDIFTFNTKVGGTLVFLCGKQGKLNIIKMNLKILSQQQKSVWYFVKTN